MNASTANNTEKKRNKVLSSSADSVLKELEDIIPLAVKPRPSGRGYKAFAVFSLLVRW